ESMTALKNLSEALGSNNTDCRADGAALDAGTRAGYLFNTTIAGIDDSDACLIIGSNPRREAPVINARIRKRYLMGGFKAGLVGESVDLTYACDNLGAGVETLNEILEGKHAFSKVLKNAKKPMLILGQGALMRSDGAAVLGLARKLAEAYDMVTDGWNGFNVLHTAAARVGGLDIGFVPSKGGLDVAGILDGAVSGKIKTVYLLGADEIDTSKLANAFVIYQGHHGDAGAHAADVVLPGAAYTEKNATYVNTEGRIQHTRLAVFPPGDAREDWTIIRALSDVLGKTLPCNSLDDVRSRMAAMNPVFGGEELVTAEWGTFGSDGAIESGGFASCIETYYMTDPISRNSETMARCIRALYGDSEGKTGTDG
ncbi:MAG: molybdopterin-dependent oxidoreductase, partial [Rhodospirillaceae bacterium]|nr:molybdopterin-dependent oxidoreductase [Rhodospirillaceae bacterium]